VPIIQQEWSLGPSGQWLSLLAVGACASPSLDLGAVEQPIVGGAAVEECGWPSTVLAAQILEKLLLASETKSTA
jgi:hypothetical protein